jgi:diguanylate cyclase (GGDEF)-like protein
VNDTADSTVGRTRAERIVRRVLTAVLVGGTTAVALYDWFGVGGSGLDFALTGPVYDAVIIAAGLACLMRAAAAERERGAWILIGLGVLSWAAAEVYWTAAIEGNPNAPYPSPADVGYLLFYPLSYAGLALLVRANTDKLDWRLWMDGLIAVLGTAALGASFVFDFVAAHTSGTPLQVAVALAYPLGDIAMLALAIGAIALTRWRPGRTWILLLAGLSALVVADIAYTLQTTEAILPSGNWIDPIYLIAALCLGAEMWQPRAKAIEASARFDGWRELMVPALFFGVMIGLFAMQVFSATSGLSTALWAATMTAVIIRLAISVRENKRLLEQVQTDPLTGLGNRGRMQVDLEELCARATEEGPVQLIFLDLNGFKSFNDSLGHPAGDELLTRIGSRLRSAVGGDGTAYRVGGDEFCVLLTCARQRFEGVTRMATEALSEKGPGYDVAPAWGAAAIPAEADEPSAALQLADVRMYAQKESRRSARETSAESPLQPPSGTIGVEALSPGS